MNKTKRILSLTLALIMLLCLFPMSAFADSLGDVVFTVKANKDAGLGGDVAVTFTQSNGKYTGTLYLPGSADTSKLFFSWSDGVTVEGQESGSAPVAAAGQSVSYTVSFGGQTATFTVTTMQGSVGVEGMFLTVDESRGTIAAMNGDLDHETSCYGSVVFGGESYFMSMKGRGNWTWHQGGNVLNDKKPYNLTLYKDKDCTDKKKVEFINGIKTKKWTLTANYADGSLMHNKIAYDLACAMGIGLESRYVDIWMNGEYIGNYLLTAKNDYGAPDGGFALELDNNFDTEDPYFALEGMVATGTSENVFTVKNVGDDAKEAGLTTEDIQSWMQTMLDAVMDSDSDEYTKYIDVDSWAKFYLLHEFCKSIDSLCGSQLMHRDGLTENDKLIAGPIWDMDVAFGHVFNSGKYGISAYTQSSADGWIIDSINGSTSFLQYLGMHKDFMERVYEIFNEYLDAFAYTVTEIDMLKEELEASAQMNYSVFSVTQTQYNATYLWQAITRGSGKYGYSLVATRSWDDYVKNLKAYISTRYAFFYDNMMSQTPTGSISGRTKLAVGDTMTLTANVNNAGSITYQWQSSADGANWTDVAGATEKTFSAVITADMDGLFYRCTVVNAPIVNTSRVAKAPIPAAEATLDAVTVTVHVHDYTASITAPNCTERGYTTHTCVECEDSYVDTYTDALGHNYQNGRCTRCGAAQPTQPGGGGSGSTSFLGSIINAIRQMFTNFFEFFARIFSFGR